MADDTLYTGYYPYKKCTSKELVPYHDSMNANCKQGGGVSTKKGSMTKRKVELHAQISELKSTKHKMISEMKTRPSEDNKPKSRGGGSVDGSRAGTALGGNEAKSGNK